MQMGLQRNGMIHKHNLRFTNVCSDAPTFEDSQARASIHTGINADHYAQFIKFGFTN